MLSYDCIVQRYHSWTNFILIKKVKKFVNGLVGLGNARKETKYELRIWDCPMVSGKFDIPTAKRYTNTLCMCFW